MFMDAIKQDWIDKTHEAIFTVERYLGIKGEKEGVGNFSQLANWIYTTEANVYEFMPADLGNVKSSAQTFAQFLQTLHHSMVDDGSLIFVEKQGSGSFMLLNVDHDDADLIHDIYEKRHPDVLGRPYEVHQDLARFLTHATRYSNKRDLALDVEVTV